MSFTYPNNFFLSAVAKDGFRSLLAENASDSDYKRVYILKGAPGTGKSDALYAAAETLSEMGVTVWLAQNPFSPEKIDGVFAPELKMAAINGAYPHDICERRAGIRDITVDLGAACDPVQLREKAAQAAAAYNSRDLHFARAGRYVSAAQSLANDTFRMAADCTDSKKAAKFAMLTAAKVLGRKRRDRGSEQIRFLSALTPDGIIFRGDTLRDSADRIVVMNDRFGAAAQVVMTAVRYTALELGFDIITCMCPLAQDKCEHIIVPEVRVAFCTENAYHSLDGDERRYHARRFTDTPALNLRRQRLSFNRKAVDELLRGACESLKAAREQNERLRAIYADACDKAASAETVERLCRMIYEEV